MYMAFLPIFIFLVGLMIGSFLNVVILRINTGRSFVSGRSKCARCNRDLEWYELFPVFSFLALRGKCRTCRAPISFQYPIVELVTAITFMLLYVKLLLPYGFELFAWINFIFSCVIAAMLIVIMVYDVKHKIVPDSVVYSFILLAIASVVYKGFTVPGFMVGGALVDGVTLALPFFLLWFLSKGKVMGFGDVKLALGMGWLLGLSVGFAAMVIAFWIGGVAGLFLLGAHRHYSMKSEVPFAPFLILGLFIAGVWHITMSMIFPLWP